MTRDQGEWLVHVVLCVSYYPHEFGWFQVQDRHFSFQHLVDHLNVPSSLRFCVIRIIHTGLDGFSVQDRHFSFQNLVVQLNVPSCLNFALPDCSLGAVLLDSLFSLTQLILQCLSPRLVGGFFWDATMRPRVLYLYAVQSGRLLRDF